MSHTITDGLVTYPGLPAPTIKSFMTFDESHDHYDAETEFSIGEISMVGNTGTYLDTPAHRHRSGWDLELLPLEQVAGCPGIVIRCRGTTERAIHPDALRDFDIENKAVLFDTGWSRYWATPEYGSGHPYVAADTVAVLAAAGPALVGIDSLNIDATEDGSRVAHTTLLDTGIPIVEHLTDLSAVPDSGFRFFAVPPKVRGLATFPVRAFALIDD